MKIAIVANAERAKDIPNEDLLNDLTQNLDLSYKLYIEKPGDLTARFENILKENYQALLIVGGDGTVRTGVQILSTSDIPLAILPRGTFNHFAKELAQPTNLADSLKMIKNRKTKTVDIGCVNDLIFINHSSIGFYSGILKAREKHKKLLSNKKVLKIFFVLFNFFKKIPIYNLKFEIENQVILKETAFVFIGNNYHFTNLFDVGSREQLTRGFIAVNILNSKSKMEIIKAIPNILLNTFDKKKYLTQFITKDMVIESTSKLINVVIDGDLYKLQSPLHYSINPKQLTMLIP